MRSLVPKPFLLVLVLLVIIGAIVVIETRSSVTDSANTQAATPPPASQDDGGTSAVSRGRTTPEKVQEPHRGSSGEELQRAAEIVAPSGFINTDGISICEARGEKVVLVDFWTYSCYNCQNTQPYLNAWHEEYADDGLLVIGVHTPEFGFEKERENVERAVREAGIEYPVVLDNSYATWNAYDQRYWPAMYLIDAGGFIRYKHFGEGAYGETEAKIRDLLAERDRDPD